MTEETLHVTRNSRHGHLTSILIMMGQQQAAVHLLMTCASKHKAGGNTSNSSYLVLDQSVDKQAWLFKTTISSHWHQSLGLIVPMHSQKTRVLRRSWSCLCTLQFWQPLEPEDPYVMNTCCWLTCCDRTDRSRSDSPDLARQCTGWEILKRRPLLVLERQQGPAREHPPGMTGRDPASRQQHLQCMTMDQAQDHEKLQVSSSAALGPCSSLWFFSCLEMVLMLQCRSSGCSVLILAMPDLSNSDVS